MKAKLTGFFCCLLFNFGCDLFQHKQPEPDFYLGGIQLDEPNMEAWVDSLAGSGMNTVSVSVYASQGPWYSDHLTQNTYLDSLVLAEIKAARSRGLHVVLIPRVTLNYRHSENAFLWHGMVLPLTEEVLLGWFKKYSEFVLKWAEIAEKENVDIFAIGSELNELVTTWNVDQLPGLWEYYSNAGKLSQAKDDLMGFSDQIEEEHLWTENGKVYSSVDQYLSDEHRAKMAWATQVSFGGDSLSIEKINRRRKLQHAQWLQLIEAVRGVYGGKLTYAANFDNYYDFGFWPQLDLFGINAYFKLRDNLREEAPENLRAGMVAKWHRVFADLDTFRIHQGMPQVPMLFTEIGYTFRKNSTITPWTGGHFDLVPEDSSETLLLRENQPIDLQERTLAMAALFRVHEGYPNPLLKGLLYWNLSTNNNFSDNQPYTLEIGLGSRDPIMAELRRFLAEQKSSIDDGQ